MPPALVKRVMAYSPPQPAGTGRAKPGDRASGGFSHSTCVLVRPRRMRPVPGRIGLPHTGQVGFGRGSWLMIGPAEAAGSPAAASA